MKSTSWPYRQAIFEALDGNITYNAAAVPVVSAISEATGYYIVLDAVTSSPDNNKHKFMEDNVLLIDIVDYQTRAASYKAVNDIFTLVMGILIPTPNQAGFSIDSGFQALCVEVISQDEIFEPSHQKVVRKVARIRCKIVDNT